MKEICDRCTHQKQDDAGYVKCGRYYYSGSSNGVATCIHDSNLTDLFSARTGSEISIKHLSAMLNRLRTDNSDLCDKINRLQDRLITD